MKKNDNKTKKNLSLGQKIKLKIDSRTIVIVKTKEALKMWMNRHPSAQVIA